MTTWNTADPAKVIDAIKTLVGADWPKTRIEAQDLLTMHGWGRDHRGSFVTNFGITPGYALVSQSNNAAVDVSFALCDVFPDDDEPAKADFVHDLFTEYTGHFTQAWGKPIKRITKPDPEIWWNSGNDCIVALRRSTIAPYVDFYTPNGVPLLKISIT